MRWVPRGQRVRRRFVKRLSLIHISQISAGDIISLRGAGKGSVTGTGGTSRKGRLFVYAEILK